MDIQGRTRAHRGAPMRIRTPAGAAVQAASVGGWREADPDEGTFATRSHAQTG